MSEAKRYFVWSSIEMVDEEGGVYEDLAGTTKKLNEFETYEEALSWQASLSMYSVPLASLGEASLTGGERDE